jgi:hypothetical protein
LLRNVDYSIRSAEVVELKTHLPQADVENVAVQILDGKNEN